METGVKIITNPVLLRSTEVRVAFRTPLRVHTRVLPEGHVLVSLSGQALSTKPLRCAGVSLIPSAKISRKIHSAHFHPINK